MSSANSTGFETVDIVTITFIYIYVKRSGPRLYPCRMPHIMFIQSESVKRTPSRMTTIHMLRLLVTADGVVCHTL